MITQREESALQRRLFGERLAERYSTWRRPVLSVVCVRLRARYAELRRGAGVHRTERVGGLALVPACWTRSGDCPFDLKDPIELSGAPRDLAGMRLLVEDQAENDRTAC